VEVEVEAEAEAEAEAAAAKAAAKEDGESRFSSAYTLLQILLKSEQTQVNVIQVKGSSNTPIKIERARERWACLYYISLHF
jgi:hypothetical protein